MEAQVALSGNLGSDVEMKRGEGYCYARFRLGCTPRIHRAEGWTNADTTWIGVSASKRLAENIERSLHKGDPVIVVGRLRTRAWTDQAGQHREMTQIEASSVGHDLTRGVSTFVRSAKPAEGADDAASWSVDPETGEVVEVSVDDASAVDAEEAPLDVSELLAA